MQQADAVVEADGVAHVPDPVVGRAQLLGGRELAGDVGEDGQLRLGEGEPGEDVAELGEHGVHARRVEGVGDAQPPGLDTALREGLGDIQHGVLVAGEDDGAGAVDGGDGEALAPAVDPLESLDDIGLGGGEGDHGAAAGQLAHETAAGGDEATGVLQREHAGDVRGGDLADGVPEEEGGPHAPALKQPEERDLDREERGLGKHRLVEQPLLGGPAVLTPTRAPVPIRSPALVLTEDHLAQRAPQQRIERGADLVEGCCEERMAGVKLATHADALGALAGEEEGEGATPGDPLVRIGPGLAARERAQGGQKLVALATEQHGPALEPRAVGEREPDISGSQIGTLVEEVEQSAGLAR